jgi:hypothetical protein
MRTNDLLATGGMMQEGGTTDPVSGNDVPAGSLKEEVRDDIPAQLSPGEFVFPADVTRYIGLDKLMQIREAAKEGLKEMESKGQMGNAEEVADDSVDEDKFSTNIDEIISGLGDSEPKKFAEGGAVNTSDYKNAPIKGFKMVQYEDVETKAVKYIPFINGKPLLPIPKGYVEKKSVAPVTPPPTTPVVEQPIIPTVVESGGGGAGNRGGDGGRDSGGEGGKTVNDAGVEGFGDIQGGTNRNFGRAAGFIAGLANPVFGLAVSAASQYAIKVDNEKKAEANAAAIDASALAAAGFEAKDIQAAKDAAAKATIEGKSAKDIAVAAANAASKSADPIDPPKGQYGKLTSLDALIGITNGWNTANPEVMKADAMPDALKGQVPVGAWSDVVSNIKNGDTPEKAVEKAVAAYGLEGRVGYQSTFDSGVQTTTSATTTEAQVNRMLSDSGLEGKVPAGKYDSVVKSIQDGLTPEQAVFVAVRDDLQESINAKTEQYAAEAADRAAREAEAAEQSERTRKEAEAEAANQRSLEAARAAADATEAADRAARQQEATDRAARDKEAADREAANQRSLDAARAEADRAERDAAADRESRSGGRDGGYTGGGSNPGDSGRGGGGAHAGGNGGEGGGLGAGSGGGRYA